MVRIEDGEAGPAARATASWLTTDAPELTAVAGLRRGHIERYKRRLAERPSVRGGQLKIGRLSSSARFVCAWSALPSGAARMRRRES